MFDKTLRIQIVIPSQAYGLWQSCTEVQKLVGDNCDSYKHLLFYDLVTGLAYFISQRIWYWLVAETKINLLYLSLFLCLLDEFSNKIFWYQFSNRISFCL